MVPGNEATVSGKKTVWTIMVGFVVFTVVMSALTYYIAQWTTPYFVQKEKERRAEMGRAPQDARPEPISR